jgi:tRNA pseudouridine32 synthase/23S rRNA pseudouridine746 synthase
MSDFTYAPPDEPVRVIHADHEVLLVDKPAGLLSVPGKGDHLADCMIARVQKLYPEALLVHRLDLDTSGVMVFALTRHAQRVLGLQFEERQARAEGGQGGPAVDRRLAEPPATACEPRDRQARPDRLARAWL